MTAPALLSREALRRVLQSLLFSERTAVRGRCGPSKVAPERLPAIWPDTLRLSDAGDASLGCDSLEVLQLAAAANEMFHLHEGGDEANLLTVDTFGGWLDHIETALRSGVAQMTFLTSGSTGAPKRCGHPFAHIRTEAQVLARRLADRRRIVALAPAHHIYGFIFTALLPDLLGVDVWRADRASPGELARGLRPGDLIVTFPERWAWLERSLSAWPHDVMGVTSTAPCPEGLVTALRRRGLTGMVEVYGSSETAGIALRDHPEDPYTLMPQWQFAASAASETPVLVHVSGRRAALPDHIAMTGDRLFRLAERVDGAVQVGGINVHPDRIAALLAERPGVQMAAVRLMRPEQGSRLKAFIVPQPGVHPGGLEADVAGWAARQLPAAERPVSFTFGPNLPTSELGKAIDW